MCPTMFVAKEISRDFGGCLLCSMDSEPTILDAGSREWFALGLSVAYSSVSWFTRVWGNMM